MQPRPGLDLPALVPAANKQELLLFSDPQHALVEEARTILVGDIFELGAHNAILAPINF